MPGLNPTAALTSPMLMDRFDVNTRRETLVKGRSTLTVTTKSDVGGVVNAASSNDLERLPEYDVQKRYISIVTRYAIRGPRSGFKADTVTWRGSEYLVETIDPYPQYGPGFVQVIAGSVDITDTPAP